MSRLIPFRKVIFFIAFTGFVIFSCEPEEMSLSNDWEMAECPIPTKWSRSLSPESVWQEYPRPMMTRGKWLNINGLWEYTIQPKEINQPARYDGQILVPFPIESAISGVKKRVSSAEQIWYKREISIPTDWTGSRILLHFEAVDWETTVYIDDLEVGRHKGGYDPFSIDITEEVSPGEEHELVVSVWDPTNGGAQPRGKQVSNPEGIYYTPSSGIWQTVWLEPVPQASIDDLKIIPDVDGKAFLVSISGTNFQSTDAFRVFTISGGDTVGTKMGLADTTLALNIASPRLWSPDDPFLYDLKFQLLRNDSIIDEVESYAGMRIVELKQDEKGITRIYLNNEFVFQNGPLDQGFWPDGLYTPPSDDAMKYDLEVIKKLGFNMLRKHVKIESRRFYHWCDKIGLWVWQDMPSGDKNIGKNEPDITRTPNSSRQFEKELTQMIRTKYNHPSIIMWVAFNEGWGQFETPRITKLIKNQDPTRLVSNASGWTDRKVGDIYDLHHYPNPIPVKPEANRAAVLGEFGGLGFPVKKHTWKQENWGYKNMETIKDLTNRYEVFYAQVKEYIADPGLSAVVYTQTTDVETETNGLMTYDRAVIKMDENEVRQIHAGFHSARLEEDDFRFVDEYEVILKCPTPGAVIRYTIDGSKPSESSPIYENPFKITESAVLKTQAFWPNGKSSNVNSYELTSIPLQQSVTVKNPQPGIQADFFKGKWNALPQFDTLTVESTGIQPIPNIDSAKTDEYFGYSWTGFLSIPQTGKYTFYLTSDDGSKLIIGDQMVIDHDGTHGMVTKKGLAKLSDGYHMVQIQFFQGRGGKGFKMEYEGPGIKRKAVPAELFAH